MAIGTDPPGSTTVPGRRATRQRAAVAAVLDSVGEFRSAQELHALLRHGGENVGLTTVYRTLTALAQAGAVDTILREDGEALYRRCDETAHHHHLGAGTAAVRSRSTGRSWRRGHARPRPLTATPT